MTAAKEKERTKMSDTVSKVITFHAEDGSEVKIESLLRVSALKWLEKRTGKTFGDFAEDLGSGSVSAPSLLLAALYRQTHPDCTDDEAEAAIDHLTLTELMDIVEQLDVLDFEPKNSQEPKPQAKTVTAKKAS